MRFRLTIRLLCALAVVPAILSLAACESTEEAVMPSILFIESGNGQESKAGTLLPEPLVVRVQYHDRSDAAGFVVRFTVTEGGGAVSKTTKTTDGRGLAPVSLTLGPVPGTNRVVAELTGETKITTEFLATGGEFFCEEGNPEFVEKFYPGGLFEKDLLLFTHHSRLNTSAGSPITGVVKLPMTGVFQPSSFASYDEGLGGRIPVLDCAFSSGGDFFLAWQDVFDEIVKVKRNKQAEHFATLATVFGGELTTAPLGVLVGCDEYGPFVVGCRDTLQRFSQATYSGNPIDEANFDAVAVDLNPQNPWYEDIYFIDLSDNTLRRLPVDTLVAKGPTEVVAQLSAAEATGARGMECNHDGTIFILVDDHRDNKTILQVTPAGVKTVAFDFFSRGTGTANEAGVLSDLAIRRGGNPILYTIDTENNMLLRYDVGQQVLSELFPDADLGMDPESISIDFSNGERVGLVVMPSG
jgi:hypothetical protein